MLRVASYNLRDLKDDPAAAARVVRAIDPDVLCLQEVPRHPLSGHRVAGFAARCGLYWSGDHRGSGGTTVLTSLRVTTLGVWHAGLRVPRFKRERGYAVARVAPPDGPAVTVASVHLGLDGRERVAHVTQVLAALRGAGGGQEPAVLAGDLNEGPGGAVWTLLTAVLEPVGPVAPTFPARHPRHRLDVVFAGAALRAVAGPPSAPDGHDLGRASDHLPVWADLAPGETPG